MATVSKKDIQITIRNFEIEITGSINQNKFEVPIGWNPVIYSSQLNSKYYRVGWHFEKDSIIEGDVIKYDNGTVEGSTAIVELVITYRGK